MLLVDNAILSSSHDPQLLLEWSAEECEAAVMKIGTSKSNGFQMEKKRNVRNDPHTYMDELNYLVWKHEIGQHLVPVSLVIWTLY